LETGRVLLEPAAATPYLVVDLDMVVERYSQIRRHLPDAQVYYAVKANPAAAVLRVLVEQGAGFDCASVEEIDAVLAAGAPPSRISYGNTIKKVVDIARAHSLGVGTFAFDSAEELEKLSLAAPGARVFCRILADRPGARWPLARKFGCAPRMARDLMLRAARQGLRPIGLSFHLGSQQCDEGQWAPALAEVAEVWAQLAAHGLELDMVNLGGGLPAAYLTPAPSLAAHASAMTAAVRRHFPVPPTVMIEPGRALVADAGVIVCEVVLVSVKDYTDQRRWVYLDVGKFGGLIETIGEAIQYRLTTDRDGGASGPVVLAGPTCDSMDVLYEHTDYRMPLDLRAGDRVLIHGAGAYTSSYCSVGFNGFPPLPSYFVGTGAGAGADRPVEAMR
jgi:ornithine decarboxylase